LLKEEIPGGWHSDVLLSAVAKLQQRQVQNNPSYSA
jgi:hypothetical protein